MRCIFQGSLNRRKDRRRHNIAKQKTKIRGCRINEAEHDKETAVVKDDKVEEPSKKEHTESKEPVKKVLLRKG